MSEIQENTVKKGQACDNCRIKKIKCNNGQPCDCCLKAQEKIMKKNLKSNIQLPLLKCTYDYEVHKQKHVVAQSKTRITEKQILTLLNNKVNDMEKLFSKDEAMINKLREIENLNIGGIEKQIIANEEYSQMVKMLNQLTNNLDKLVETDLDCERQIIENSIADNYSKIIEYDTNTNSILNSLKNESAFTFRVENSEKMISKKPPNLNLIKKLGIHKDKNVTSKLEIIANSNINNIKPQNRGFIEVIQEQEKISLHNAYQEQEKEGFDSAISNHTKNTEKLSIKSKICDLANPEILSNLLKSTNAYSNVAYYLSRIKQLSDLLKTDSELYLKKLMHSISQPVYLDVPYDLFDLLINTYKEKLQYWNFYITKQLLKKLAFHFKHDQKRMHETDLFLMNVILLMSCKGYKFSIDQQSEDNHQWSKKTIQEWETTFLLNCLAFYQKFLIFPKPIIDPSLDVSSFFEKTLRKLQAFFLLGHYYNNSPCPRLSVHLFSIVITVGQDFNYDNLATYGSSLNMDLKVQARNLWICSFITEKHISVTFGNPEFLLGFDPSIMIDDIFKRSLESYDINLNLASDDLVIDYSSANTPWIKFLKSQKTGLLVIGFFLRLQLLQIETVYYKTIVASKNENANIKDTLNKAESLLKAYEDFEAIAKTYLEIEADLSIEDWIKRLTKKFQNKDLDHEDKIIVDLTTYLFLTLYTLKLSCSIIVADIRYNLQYNDVNSKSKNELLTSLTKISSTQIHILDYLLETGWAHCASTEIAISYISCLSCLFYNSVLDKDYFKMHIKKMMSIIKKFSNIAAKPYFFDPVKWNTAAAHTIFFMRILAACHPEVFEEVLQADPKTVFYKEYQKAYEGIKNFKKMAFKNIKKTKTFITDLKESEKVLFTDCTKNDSNIITPTSLLQNAQYEKQDVKNVAFQASEQPFFSPFKDSNGFIPFSPTDSTLQYLKNTPNKEGSTNSQNSLMFKDSIENGSSNEEINEESNLLNMLDPKYVFNLNNDVEFPYDDKHLFDNEFKYPNEEQMFAVSNDLDSLIKNNFYTSSVFNTDDFLKDDLLFDQIDKQNI